MKERLTIIFISCTLLAMLIYTHVLASSATGTGVSVGEFFTAIDKGDVDVVKTYIQLGNDIKVKSEKGYSALAFLFRSRPYKGSKTSQEKIAGLLLDAGASVNETIPVEVNRFNVPVFVWAVHTDNAVIVDLFIRRGVNKEARIEGLFAAVSRGHINICKRILDSGIDINSRDKFGQTPLFLVGSVGMTQYLVSRGADVNAKNDDGESLLGWLSKPINETDQRIISYLVSKGAKTR
jgi:ankyrin repeat protein